MKEITELRRNVRTHKLLEKKFKEGIKKMPSKYSEEERKKETKNDKRSQKRHGDQK